MSKPYAVVLQVIGILLHKYSYACAFKMNTEQITQSLLTGMKK